MDFFSRFKKPKKGGYIFLSHSHEDIEKVRHIRNELESAGFEPLCFYLKCLDDDSELENLIEREIDAREWFVFADSPNARHSKWVTRERNYVKKSGNKKIFTVDVNDPRAVEKVLNRMTHRLRIFMAYSQSDRMLAERVRDCLQAKDFLVYWPEDMVSTGDFSTAIFDAVTEACQDGAVLALLTPNMMDSPGARSEIELAFRQRGRIIPVLVGDVKLNVDYQFLFIKSQCYFLSENPTDEELAQLAEKIAYAVLTDK